MAKNDKNNNSLPTESCVNKNSNIVATQSNKLIVDTYTNLTLSERKLLSLLIGLLKPTDTAFPYIEIPMETVSNALGVVRDSGGDRKRIKAILHNLLSKTIVSTSDDLIFDGYTWFSFIRTSRDHKKVSFMFNPTLAPFLLNLQQNFTAYRVAYMLELSSIYSSRLYELCRCFCWTGVWTVDVQQFRCMMGLSDLSGKNIKYAEFKALNRSVIIPAVDEVNKKTDISIDVKYNKKSWDVISLSFTIKKVKKTIPEAAKLRVAKMIEKATVTDSESPLIL